MAYGQREVQGGPNWVDAEHFDVAAHGRFAGRRFFPAADGSPPTVYLMLQTLLTDRFKLQAHVRIGGAPHLCAQGGSRRRASRAAPSNDRRWTATRCSARRSKGETASSFTAGRADATVRAAPRGGARDRQRRQHGAARATPCLAPPIAVIVDQTGLPGFYDLDFEWGELTAGRSDIAPPSDRGCWTMTCQCSPRFGTSSGVKLEATRADVDIVVIDHAEQPTQN